jgi:hypothetical protein
MATNGITLITPTSVAVTGAGSSATINAGGSVTFATAETLSLNGVFTSLYDNYIIDMRFSHLTTNSNITYRLRAAGTDATGSNYTYQLLQAASTTVSGSRATLGDGYIADGSNSQRSGFTAYFYGPSLAQPTAARSVTVSGRSDAQIVDWASTHSLSTAYDGFTIYPQQAGGMSGLIKVYGLVQ